MGRRDDDEDEDELDLDDEVLAAGDAVAALMFGISLLLSLLLSAPTLWAAFNGRRDLEAALLHYLLCFVVARVSVGVVASLYGGYRRAQGGQPGRAAAPVTGPMTESR